MKFTASRTFVAVGLAFVALSVGAPLAGWPPTLRLSAVLGVSALLVALSARPWRWGGDWRHVSAYDPSSRVIALGALLAGLVLFWIVLTLFEGGHINAVDFTIYFDRPLYQTIHGRPLYVETTDDPAFAHLTHLGVHAYWLLVPFSLFYTLHASPLWLLTLSVVAVVAGSVHIVRIGRQAGFGGTMSCAAAFAFLLNDNTARALRYGFHPEVLYAWFVPWMIDAGLRGAKQSYLAAAVACVLVKEDACLPLFAVTVVLILMRGRSMTAGDRAFFLAVPLALALANLAVFYAFVVPALWPTGAVAYANFWSNYGRTPILALLGMATHPVSVARDTWTSGLTTVVLPPFLFLPLIGWRWSIGILPLALIFGASANDQVRGFGIYYAIYLVPFLSLAAAAGALTVMRRVGKPMTAVPAAAGLVVLGALVVGPGYALRSWRMEVAAVPRAIELLPNEHVVLVQSGLYPHAGYDARVQLLTVGALRDPVNADAAILIARGIGAYPLQNRELDTLLHRPSVAPMPAGLIAVRNPTGAVR